jgi:ribonuclease D
METIYSRLRQWRLMQAKSFNLPVFFILSNAHLAAVAAAHPTTVEELALCPGIGPKKLALYGESLVEQIVLAMADQLEPGVFLAEPEPKPAAVEAVELSEKDLVDIAASLRKELAQRITARFRGRFSAPQIEEALRRLGLPA